MNLMFEQDVIEVIFECCDLETVFNLHYNQSWLFSSDHYSIGFDFKNRMILNELSLWEDYGIDVRKTYII